MASDFETLLVDRHAPGLVVVTLNRPERLNAMTDAMFVELDCVARELDQDDDLRVVILTGAGNAFCSGYDLSRANDLTSIGALTMLKKQELAARALLAVRTLRVPVIAAIDGPAVGGGLSLSLACDIRLATPRATFGAAFVGIGLSAGDLGTSWLLTRLIGPADASEICFTGRMVDADEAYRLGLVNRVSDSVISDAITLAEQIMVNSPGGVQLSKRALQANLEITSYAAALELENRGQALLTRTSDMVEALAAMRENRPAVFRGA
jgi:enoyl-CoA hydratase/carnithine racemase